VDLILCMDLIKNPNYELAQRRFRIMIPLSLCAAGYLLGVMRWHETPLQVVAVLGAMSMLALGLSFIFLQKTGVVRILPAP